jgi:hypothetical protein
MRLLALILALAISAQPLQAGFCDMDMGKGQETGHYMDDAADTGHDCCDTDDADLQQEQGCDGMAHCAPCFLSTPVLPVMTRLQLAWTPQHAESAWLDPVLANHSSPPFRPPIS